ncbi:DUF3558 family protein [Saccharomonospora saliphila]|uniref:DUF3558 family protein n=1 Tax=Saccharomonospora saliphila TaxID=369829 RepID=UPI0003AAC249
MTLVRHGAFGATVVALGAVLGACEEPGTPTPSGAGQSTPSRSAGNAQPIPPVERPLDPSSWLASPCQALTSDDLAELGLEEGRARDKAASSARSCDWKLAGVSGTLVDLRS